MALAVLDGFEQVLLIGFYKDLKPLFCTLTCVLRLTRSFAVL